MLTVRDLLEGLDIRLLTGETGAELPVRWVHISELLDPTPWLSGGEILLSTGMLLEDAEQQRAFISRLADHQLAGLGFGIGLKHSEVPPALLQAAEERGFPVFEVPYELPFIAITEAAFTHLVNEQYAVLRRALAAQERLERIVLSERGLDALAGALASLLGASVLVLDPRGEVLAQHAFRRSLDAASVEALQQEMRERSRRPEARVFIPTLQDGSSALALAVAAEESPDADVGSTVRIPVAWLLAVKDTGALSDFDRLTLHQAVTLIALELLRARVAGDTERRLAGDVLAGLIDGELAGVELHRRLAPFGLGEHVGALVLDFDEWPAAALGHAAAGQAPASGNGHDGNTPGRNLAGGVPSSGLERALRAALRPEGALGLVAATGSLTCALVPGIDDEEMLALGERVAERVAARLGAAVRAGVGRAVPVADARRSFHEARCALETLSVRQDARTNGNLADGSSHAAAAGSVTAGGGRGSFRVASFRDIGSFRLLLSLQDAQALRLFCDSILDPIEASEGHYGGELMRSLEAFIEENGQWERAARRLYCHRHTLRYRIRRVEELTGRDLGSARDRIDFWLALRGRELVE